MAKAHVANLPHRAADPAIRINGARDYLKGAPLKRIYRYARQARLMDGENEVHRMVPEQRLAKEAHGFWLWAVDEG